MSRLSPFTNGHAQRQQLDRRKNGLPTALPRQTLGPADYRWFNAFGTSRRPRAQRHETAGHTQTVFTLARVLLTFVHRCDPHQCAALRRVTQNPLATMEERSVAKALLHVEHSADFWDRQRLANIARDVAAPHAIRALARIVAHLVHTPTAGDKVALAGILAHGTQSID